MGMLGYFQATLPFFVPQFPVPLSHHSQSW